MKRVLVIGNDTSLKGGIAISIQQILDYNWISKGFEMNYIPTYNNKNSIYMCLFFAAAYIRIFFSLCWRKPDVVHMHMSFKGSFYRKYLVQRLCNLFKVPVVIHLHGSQFDKWYENASDKLKEKIRRMMREAAVFIVLGEKWEKCVTAIEPKVNAQIVYNAVNIPNEIAEWNDERFQILFLGILIKRKGVEELVRAFHKIVTLKPEKNIKLVMTGTGEEEANLKRMIAEFGLEDKVTLAGWIGDDEKHKLLRESQLFVLPSYNEGMPRAILEAMSYGMPIVSTSVGDISVTVIDGENGYLVTPGDVDSLASKMLSIVDNKALYEKMGASSRQLTIEKFSDTAFFDKLAAIYGSCVKD